MKRNSLMPINDIPDYIFQETGVKKSRQIVYLWVKTGKKMSNGEMLKLKTVKKLGQLFSKPEWINEFLMRL